jgi:hypothetical protein
LIFSIIIASSFPPRFRDLLKGGEPLLYMLQLNCSRAELENHATGRHARRLIFGLTQDFAQGFDGLRPGFLQVGYRSSGCSPFVSKVVKPDQIDEVIPQADVVFISAQDTPTSHEAALLLHRREPRRS